MKIRVVCEVMDNMDSVNSTESQKIYDICIITAANESQARGYLKQLKWRNDKGALPKGTEFFVFADPKGKRIGSGGSTIYVLYKLLEHFCHTDENEKYHFPHELFKGKRILILHAGGDSRRLPAYSAVGKIFVPLPTSRSTDGFVTLFDILLSNLMQLPCLSNGQVIVVSGDVLLSFDASKIAFSDSGVTGLAYPGSVETASAHGVYIAPKTQSESLLRRVTDFLQKPTYDELERCSLRSPTTSSYGSPRSPTTSSYGNGLDAANRTFIDTGVMNFGTNAIKVLMEASGISMEDGKVVTEKDSLCENLINANIQLDIYKEIPFAMLGKTLSADYCSGLNGLDYVNRQSNPLNPLKKFFDSLQKIPFFVNVLPYCEFFHVGTSKQLLRNFHTINYTASVYKFQNFSNSKAIDCSRLDGAFVYNSLVNTAKTSVNSPCLIEGCQLEGLVELEGDNILTGIPKSVGNIKLQKGICMTCLPVRCTQTGIPVYNPLNPLKKSVDSGWVSIIYGIEDDFKVSIDENTSTFLNTAFLSWMEEKGILPTDLWGDNEPHELWNARLFSFSTDLAESMRISLNLQDFVCLVLVNASISGCFDESKAHDKEYFQLDRWRASSRMSLREILESVDYEKFLDNYSNLCTKVNLENLTTILTPKSDLSSDEILSWCVEEKDYATAVKTTLALIKQSEDILFQARLYKLLSNILRKASEFGFRNLDFGMQTFRKSLIKSFNSAFRIPHSVQASLSESLEDVAFELVREAIGNVLTLEHQSRRIQIRSDEVVWVCAPTRLDFAGGWSDTPPYCLEHGGSVLNAAVKLNGQYPIQVIGKLHPEPFIRINSIDLGEHIIISETSELLSYQDPTNWTALPKAAFAVTGIIPEDTKLNLQDILKELGGGIDLTLFSAVPAGSGLGTSSILGSAIIACLSRMLGQELTQDDLSPLTKGVRGLFNRTLYMEQLMTTGGGWQDQIGGVVGGVKHITTEPGLFQVPTISWTDLKVRPNMDLSERFLLYYTGLRRMAKNILRNIVGKYLDRDPVTLKTISQLREKSFEMKEEIDHRNIDAFGKKIAEVWELNKTLDPGTSNEQIEAILSKISHLIHGAKLLGAGGGGFLFMVTKGVEQTQQIRKILTENPPNDRARFFDFDIDPDGLKVSVL